MSEMKSKLINAERQEQIRRFLQTSCKLRISSDYNAECELDAGFKKLLASKLLQKRKREYHVKANLSKLSVTDKLKRSVFILTKENIISTIEADQMKFHRVIRRSDRKGSDQPSKRRRIGL